MNAGSQRHPQNGGPPRDTQSDPQRTLTLRTRLPLYLLGLLFFLQVIMPDRAWTYLLGGLGALLVVSYFWAREMRDRVWVERVSTGVWVVAGDRLEERWQLRNRSVWPVLWATIHDRSDIPGYAIDRAVAAGSNEDYKWRTQGVCTQRGVFTLGPWTLTLGDPFGLFEVQQAYGETRTLLVYPRVMKLPEFEMPRGSASGRAQRMRASPTESVLASHVRAYAPGDSLRLIHWRKSAHLGELVVKQFDLEPAGALWLLLDLDANVQAGEDPESTLEYGVILAASLAARHLNEGRAVGLIAYGQEAGVIPPQPGAAHLWRLLHALAHAAPGEGWPLARVLEQVGPDIGRGRTLLVITPSTDTAWLGELLRLSRRDIAAAALLLDAASFRDEPAPDLALAAIRDLLADYGVPSDVIDKNYAFEPLIPIRRRRKVLKTLSATGRVIEVEVEEVL